MAPRKPPSTPPAMLRQKGLAVAGAGVSGAGLGAGWVSGALGRGCDGEVRGRLGLEKDREPRLPELLPPPARAKASSSLR